MNDWFDAEQRVEKAQELFEQQKWAEALELLRAAIAIHPFNASWLFNMGLTLDHMHRHAEAIEAYEKAIALVPDDLETLNHLGIDLIVVGRFEDAIEIFEKIEQLDPTFEPSYCNRIEAYAEIGEHERAEEMFYMARLYKEQCPDCYYAMGSSLEARELYDRAIYCWQKVLDIDDQYPQVHLRLAQCYWAKGEKEKARQHFLRELRENPGDTETLLDLGELLMEMGHEEEAGEKFRRAIELTPENPSGYYCFGRWLEEAGRIDQAVENLLRVLELDPTYPSAHLALGRIYWHRQRNAAKARLHLRKELLLRPEVPGTLVELGNLLMDVGEARAAVACLKRLTHMEPDDADGWQNLAVALFMRERYAEGATCCDEALRCDPKRAVVLFNLALAMERLGRYNHAMAAVRRGLAIDPTDGALHKLQFRLRLLKIRRKLGGWFQALWPFGK